MTVNPLNIAILIGIVFLTNALVGNLLFMNPLVAGLYQGHAEHPGLKSWQSFGSLPKFIVMNLVAGLVLSVVYVVLFNLLYGNLPSSTIAAGLVFAVLILVVKAAPEAWNQYLNINYPPKLILAQLSNAAISLVLTGVVLGFSWGRWPAVS